MPEQWAPIVWAPALLISLVGLVIPAAIILGQRMLGNPVVVTAGAALLAFFMFWTLEITEEFSDIGGFPSMTRFFVLFSAVLLLLGAWALALAQAAGERRWAWVTLLSLAVYPVFVALFVMWQIPFSVCLSIPNQPYCASASLGAQTLLIAFNFIGPAVILIYGLRADRPRRGALPAGLRVSQLGEPDVEPGAKAEPL